MSLLKFYSYIDRSLHLSGLQAHPQKNSHGCSHNHWFSGCTVRAAYIQSTRPERYSHWTNNCVNSCVNSPDDGPVGPKHVEICRYKNKIEIMTSVGFSFHILICLQNCSNEQPSVSTSLAIWTNVNFLPRLCIILWFSAQLYSLWAKDHVNI
jgi:hypothetical protein